MDWKKITESMAPYVDKAKEFGKKAAKFTEGQAQTTPLFIKNQSEYDYLLSEKRVVIIGYEDVNDIGDQVRLLSSVWLTKAFVDIAKLRMVDIGEYPDLAHSIGLVWPIDMRVRFEWEETFRFTSIEEIKKWWQSPCYKKIDTASENTPATIVDPLAGK